MAGAITTIAGNGQSGWTGDGGPGTLASLEFPWFVERLADGSLVFQDGHRGRLRRLDADGTITTLAEPSCDGFCPPFPRGDFPMGYANLDIGMPSALRDGGFLFAESSMNRIRRFAADGTLSTVATIQDPEGVHADRHAGFTVMSVGSDGRRSVVRQSAAGTLTTVSGGGSEWWWEDGMHARDLFLLSVDAFSVAPNGDLLFSKDSRIWRIGHDGILHAIAGTGKRGFSGDGGPATKARVSVSCLLARPEGGILFCDGSRVRLIDTAGRVWTVAGGPRVGFGGDGGPATGSTIGGAAGLVGLPGGGFVISDPGNNRLRRVQSLTLPPDPPVPPTPPPTPTPASAPAPTTPAGANPSPQPPIARPRARRPLAWVQIRSRAARGRALIRRVMLRVPAYARFSATCRGKGCPFGRRVYPARTRVRTLELRSLRRARLRPGALLTFVLRPRHGKALVVRYAVTRAGTLRKRP